MTLPTFLVIGSQKAGTSTLHEVLSEHPQIHMSPVKEVNYFFREDRYARGPAWYADHFRRAAPEARAIGEASPGYVCHPDAPARIHALLPAARLILTVREPISRACSQYWYERVHLGQWRSFEELLDETLEEEYRPGRPGLFSRGVYMRYIERFLEYFPREQLCVLPLEDLRQEPESVYRRLYEFIEVDPEVAVRKPKRRSNRLQAWTNPLYRFLLHRPLLARWVPPRARRLFCWGRREPFTPPALSQTARQRLATFYRPWNTRLGEFLGRDLSGWSDPESGSGAAAPRPPGPA
jgi:hypothetical protein